MNLKQFVERLKTKKLDKNKSIILFLGGILLMVIAMPTAEKEKDNETLEFTENIEGQETVLVDEYTYIKNMENKLEQILSQMEGAGEVSCMVTLKSSQEQIVEKDLEVSDESVTEEDSQGGMRTTNQSSRSEITIYKDKENGSPYIRKRISPKVEGVLVIAEGGNHAVVAKNISEAIQALFGIQPHKIRIVKKGG